LPAGRGLGHLEFGLRVVTLGGQPSDLFALFVEFALGIGERRHRGVLAALRIGGGLVRLLLVQPRRGLLVHLFGPGPLQVGHDGIGACRQCSCRGLGGDDVLGASRGQVAARRTVHVGGRREGVEPLLRRGNCRVGVLDPLLAGLQVVPGASALSRAVSTSEIALSTLCCSVSIAAPRSSRRWLALATLAISAAMLSAAVSAFADTGTDISSAKLRTEGSMSRTGLAIGRAKEPRRVRVIRFWSPPARR